MKNRIREASSQSIIRMMRFWWADCILPRTPSTVGLISRWTYSPWALPLGVWEATPSHRCRHLLHQVCKLIKCQTAPTAAWCPTSSHHKLHRTPHYKGLLIQGIRPPPIATMLIIFSRVQTRKFVNSTSKKTAIWMDSRTRMAMTTTKGSTQSRW